MENNELPPTISLAPLMVDGTDDSFREMVSLLGAVTSQTVTIRGNQSQELRRDFGVDLTAAEVSLLWALVKTSKEGSSTSRRIAKYQRISGAAVSATLSSLGKKGFVEKHADEIDSRRHILRLTERGYEAVRISAEEQRKVNDVQFSGLTRKDMFELTRILSSVLEKGNLVLDARDRD